jgi:uncharacterized membrane protein (UPF0127 family)
VGGTVIARNATRASTVAERVEVAGTLWTRFMGLMGRHSIAPGDGLWLTGSNGIHMFFMRVPIDAIFLGRPGLDGARAVMAVRASLAPWTGLVPFVRGAESVLELPAGTVEASGTLVGDSIRIGE